MVKNKKPTVKTVVILKHNRGDLANQLWNYVSVYAYALERGYVCDNYSFFEHASEFPNLSVHNRFVRLIFFDTFVLMRRLSPWPITQHNLLVKAWRKVYGFYTEHLTKSGSVIDSGITFDERGFYELPPSVPASAELKAFEDGTSAKKIFLTGWLFRNPVGIEKYRAEIAYAFAPRAEVEAKISDRITSLRKNYKYIIGVHIRQKDYRTHRGGVLYIDPERMHAVVAEHLEASSFTIDQTCLIICSDEPIAPAVFEGFHAIYPAGSAVEDLFTLAKCDVIIGSWSTFGFFAAYVGNIAHITATQSTSSGVQWLKRQP